MLVKQVEYARRLGISPSVVCRWVSAGVIPSVAGRVDLEAADAALARARPRGRAAYWARRAGPIPPMPERPESPPAPAGLAFDRETRRVLAVLRGDGPRFLAARLARAGLAPGDAAKACAQFSRMLDNVIAGASDSDWTNALESGELPNPGIAHIPDAAVAEVEDWDLADAEIDAAMQACGGASTDANGGVRGARDAA